MEKTKNGWYKAVSIIEYVFAAMFIGLTILVLCVGLADAAKLAEALNKANVTDIDGTAITFTEETAKSFTVGFSLMMLPSIVVMFLVAVMFGKYAKMTDQEAAARYKGAIVWTVVTFFFGGTIVGVFALIGLLTIHARQKERHFAGLGVQGSATDAQPQQNETSQVDEQNQVMQENAKTTEKDIKTQERLARLETLKASGALTDEEYQQLKEKIEK